MTSSLGIFIEKDIIKYAKLNQEKDSIKVESFSVEFYEKGNVGAAVKKIITETNGAKCSVNVNVSSELYNYFETFSMLSKKDMKDSIDIEFDLLCGEKGYNRKSLDTRYILTTSKENADKYKVIHIAVNKNDVNKRVKEFAPVKLASMTPISTSITNLIDGDEIDNAIIVNIENETQITTVIEGQIYRTDIISDGMGKILNKINEVDALAYSIGNAIDVEDALKIIPADRMVMGNIDPAGILRNGTPEVVKAETKALMERCCKYPNFVIASGCDIPPATPLENLDAFFEAVEEFYK